MQTQACPRPRCAPCPPSPGPPRGAIGGLARLPRLPRPRDRRAPPPGHAPSDAPLRPEGACPAPPRAGRGPGGSGAGPGRGWGGARTVPHWLRRAGLPRLSARWRRRRGQLAPRGPVLPVARTHRRAAGRRDGAGAGPADSEPEREPRVASRAPALARSVLGAGQARGGVQRCSRRGRGAAVAEPQRSLQRAGPGRGLPAPESLPPPPPWEGSAAAREGRGRREGPRRGGGGRRQAAREPWAAAAAGGAAGGRRGRDAGAGHRRFRPCPPL